MDFALMVRALSRHKTIVGVLILEFAVTLAILSNALSLAAARVQILQTPSGIREAGLMIATPTAVGALSATLDGAAYDALRNLAATQPGVQAASVIGQAPLSGADRWLGIVSTEPGTGGHPIDVAVYSGDYWMPSTLGLSLAAGRWFSVDELLPAASFPEISHVHLVELTDSLSKKLFKGKDPVGQSVYFDTTQATVVGVLSNLARPGYHGGSQDQDSVILPTKPALLMAPMLAIRMGDHWHGSAEIQNRAIREMLNQRTHGYAVWRVQSYKAMRDDVFTADRAALGLLAVIVIAVVGVAANGIAASSSYWVNQRSRQTWIRRALGATRPQIIGYFVAENALICALGVTLGTGLALAVNIVLIDYLNLSRMSVQPLIVGALLALLIGQLAVLRSAIKTAAA